MSITTGKTINIALNPGESRRLLCIPDTHFRDMDFKSIQGFKSNIESFIFDRLIPKIKEYNVTDLMFLGDIIDKGYRNIGAAFSHQSLIQCVKDNISGVFGTILGNHFFIETQENPELYWVQPHETYKPAEKFYSEVPLIGTPDVIIIGKTQISCFHYNPKFKNYTKPRIQGINTHIGLYHDDCVLPNSVRGYGINNSDISFYYKNIDIAVHGHIHVPYDTTYVSVDDRQVPMIIPGACALTSADKREFHNSVKLPLFTITAETCEISYISLSLGVTNYRIVQRKEPQKEIKTRLKEIQVKQDKQIRTDSFANFIHSNKLPVQYIEYVQLAATHQLNFSKISELAVKNGVLALDKEIFRDYENHQ